MARMAAVFVPSQKGTQLLQDENNFLYRVNKANGDGSRVYYNCVKRFSLKCTATAVVLPEAGVIDKINNEHNHATSVLEKFAREEEKRMIQAAADVGTASTSQVLSQIKVNIERSELPEAKAMMRKSRCLSQALYRAKKLRLGYTGVVPKTAEKILTNLPEQFKITSDGSTFLRHMGYLDDAQTKFLMLYISDQGKEVLEKATELYCDGTFSTAPEPFSQVGIL
jgi:FLYWCH zinc finger domain